MNDIRRQAIGTADATFERLADSYHAILTRLLRPPARRFSDSRLG